MFLNSGGDPETLAQALIDRGWGPSGSSVVVTDLDGDRDQDIAMALLDPESVGTPDGTGVVWRCQDGAFQSSVVARGLAEFGPPELLRVVDLTGDGVPELLFGQTRCGAHTCFGRLAVLQFDGEAWQDRFGGPSDELPSPELEVTPAGGGRPGEIAITAQGIGSVGAGPYRVLTRRWTWDPGTSSFLVSRDSVEPPRFRIHQVHDADDAFRAGDWPTALAGYERVVLDDALLDWLEPGAGRDALAGYAAYRRVLVYLAMNDPESAVREYENRLRSAPAAAAPFARLAEAGLAQASAGGLAVACAEIVRLVEADPGPVLDPLDFGYANRIYTPGDLCPIE